MPRLCLVRHAIAEERDAGRWPDDAARPLSDRGVRRFIEAARGLRGLGMAPAVVLTSPYTRATQTAALLETHGGWPTAFEMVEFASGDLAAQIGALRAQDTADSLGVVGHEPYLSNLASLLLAGDEVVVAFDWRKGGVAILEFDTLIEGGARLVAYLPPRVLRR